MSDNAKFIEACRKNRKVIAIRNQSASERKEARRMSDYTATYQPMSTLRSGQWSWAYSPRIGWRKVARRSPDSVDLFDFETEQLSLLTDWYGWIPIPAAIPGRVEELVPMVEAVTRDPTHETYLMPINCENLPAGKYKLVPVASVEEKAKS